jgi:hypothetical protein
MHITARVLWTPKAGHDTDEYEDAFWPARSLPRRPVVAGRFRFAVADGATETSFSGLWARQLVQAYGRGWLSGDDWLAHLVREQARWYAEVQQKPLPWYAEEKVRSGAYAALVGLEVTSSGHWQSLAVGDCSLFQWRAGELVAAFPAQGSAFFTSRPFLVSSNGAENGALAERAVAVTGRWLPGDRFVLLSDALGQWLWRKLEEGAPPWPLLETFHDRGQPKPFRQWVDKQRRLAELRNDDVTAVLVAVD